MRAARSASPSFRWASRSKWMRSSQSNPDPLDPGPQGFAHRGLHHGAGFPENSLIAFAAALEMGAGIECDLRLTADDQIVVFPRSRRLGGCARVTSWVNRSTYAELSRLRVGDGPIPTLESLLELVRGRVPLLLEIKVDGDIWRWMPALKAALRDYRGRIGVMSFDPRIAALAEDQFPRVRRGLGDSRQLVPASSGVWRLRSPIPISLRSTARRSAKAGSTRPARSGMPVYSWTIRGPRATAASAGSCRRPYLGSRWPTVKPNSSRKLSSGVSGLNAAAWDRLAGEAIRSSATPSCRRSKHPEASGRAPAGRPQRSWSRTTRRIWSRAAPAYLKTHSQGEYVFDHGWADAFERAGGTYYPKLQIAVPFTPVPGPRLLGTQPQHLLAAAEAVVGAERDFVGAHHLHRRSRRGRVRAARLADSRRHPVSLAQPRLSRLRRLPGGADQPQAQGHPQGARGRARRARIPGACAGSEIGEAEWDAMWHFYQDTGARKVGPAPI